MAYQLRKSNQKRYHECEHKPEAKRQKKEAASIENICYELLERIFEFLDPHSLLKVAGTCKRLQILATEKYAQKYGDKPVCLISNTKSCFDRKIMDVRLHNDYIHVRGPSIFAFLRCFGAKISNLTVGYTNNYVTKYINRYCAGTLTRIEFHRNKKETFVKKNFSKQFKMIEELAITHSNRIFGKKFPNIVNWFPNVRRLKIHTSSINSDFTAATFPYLEHLEIYDVNNGNILTAQTEKYIVSLLHANQQLQSLDLICQVKSISHLLDIIKETTMIKKLNAPPCSSSFVSSSELSRFVKEHPLTVDLSVENYLKGDDVVEFVQKLNWLRSLQFRLRDHIEFNQIYDQLKKFPYFKDIKYSGFGVIVTFNR